MKRTILFVTLLGMSVAGLCQGRVVERTYLATDRDVYVAGDIIWCSAFCVDAQQGALSPISSVGYVELHDAATMVASAKISLLNGRGAGRLVLPTTLPTGNYRMVVYTSQNKAETGYDFNGIASKTISVFNVFSNERIKDGVEVVDPEAYAQLVAERSPVKPGMTNGVKPGMTDGVIPGSGRASVEVEWRDGALTLVNHGDKAATLSLSAFHDDGILSNGNPSIVDFMAGCRQVGPQRFDNTVIPEYEGEIIRGHITSADEETLAKLFGKYAFISTPSDEFDVYASVIDENGRVEFFTGNIYGNKEYICEIEGIDPSLNCFVELDSPFEGAVVEAAPMLRMSASIKDVLLGRSVAMQVERQFTSDTLLESLPVRPGADFGEDEIIYPLDDYTRFTTMEEVLVEFVQELRARRTREGARDIQVRLDDGTEPRFSKGRSLMMIDGVPVFDQQKIMDYDPLLVESINIYPHTCFIGSRSFEGIVNFVTYRHNLPSFKFGSNVRVIDFEGVPWPTAFTGASLREADGYPDYRQTIYWHPALELKPGETQVIPCKLPDYKGRFRVVVEGLSADGMALLAETSFTTE